MPHLTDEMVRGLRLRENELVADRFEILDEAGAGGRGMVYRARDGESGQLVALKVLSSRAGDQLRFDLETTILAKLHHPRIVAYVAHGRTVEDEPWLAMEWLAEYLYAMATLLPDAPREPRAAR